MKSPKIYFRDTGLLHLLFGCDDIMSLLSHPKLGLSWEGWCIEQIIHILDVSDNAYFYATHGGAELDLLINYKGKRYGFEFKYMDSPGVTKSMTVVLEDLKLERLYVVYPGQRSFPMKDSIELLPISKIKGLKKILGG